MRKPIKETKYMDEMEDMDEMHDEQMYEIELDDEEDYFLDPEENVNTFKEMLEAASVGAPEIFMITGGVAINSIVIDSILNLIESVPSTTMSNINELLKVLKIQVNARTARRVTEKLKDHGVIEGKSGAWTLTGVEATYN